MEPHIVALVGRSQVGKTHLMESLLIKLSEAGIRVDTVKHTHHRVFEDIAGTDSSRHRRAGALRTILAGPGFCNVFIDDELSLAELLQFVSRDVDLVLIEGFKSEPIRRVEVVRGGKPVLAEGEAWMTVTSDQSQEVFEAVMGLLGKVP